VFAGNTHDSCTLRIIVTTMEARHGVLGRVWIADRGMASADNLAWLRETRRRYIIGAPKSELKKFAAELANTHGWHTVQEGVEVKLSRQAGETVILCRSQDRRSKEQARCSPPRAPIGKFATPRDFALRVVYFPISQGWSSYPSILAMPSTSATEPMIG
jgi:hypothetical protein